MESPASGADSSSDADSRPNTPSLARAAVLKGAGYAELSIEGRLIKWWEAVRASDRQPWLTPVPSPLAPPLHHRQQRPPTGTSSQQASSKSGAVAAATATATTTQPQQQRTPPSTRPAKAAPKRKVTLVSPPGSRSCGPFMCHGLHNNYLIDEHSASLKETPSAARLAAERKKAAAPKPFLVGGRAAGGGATNNASQGAAAAGGRRPAPWRPTRTKNLRDPFPFSFDASEDETRKAYREWQLNSSLRQAAVQLRKLRQNISARSGGPSGAVGSGDTLKAGDCLRVLTKLSDTVEEESPGEEDPGLIGALLILSSENRLNAHAEKAPTPPSKGIDKEYKHTKAAHLGPNLGFKENKGIQAKIRIPRRITPQASLPQASGNPSCGRKDLEKKVSRQKSRSTVKVSSRLTALKKTLSGGKQTTKKSVFKSHVEGNSEVERKRGGVEEANANAGGTRTAQRKMFGSSPPATAHIRGNIQADGPAPARASQHAGHNARRRSESQLVSAAESEAAKWLANRTGPRRQAAGIPVVELLLPNSVELRTPPGDARTAGVAPHARRPKAPSFQPTAANVGSWTGGLIRPTGERSAKKWMPPPRRRATPTRKGGTGSALRRCFGEPMTQFEMDEIEDALIKDWPELSQQRGGYTRTTKGNKISVLDGDEYSDTGNEYLELAGPEHNTGALSKLRMLGSMPKSLFGRGVDQDATLPRMGFPAKQKTSMETQVTPRQSRLGRRAMTTGSVTEQKRSVDVSAGTAGTSVESAIPLALRRDCANQAFKAVLDMVVQKAEARGGAGGDVNWAAGQGAGDAMLFRNFLTQALKSEHITHNSAFGTQRDVPFNIGRGTTKYIPEWRKPHPKSAEESIKNSRLRSPRPNKHEDNTFNALMDISGSRRPFTPKSRGRKTQIEGKCTSRGVGIGTEELAYPSPRQVPAINRAKTLTSANLGELVSTLRRAEKLS